MILIGLCHKCYSSNTPIVLDNFSKPICNNCNFKVQGSKK